MSDKDLSAAPKQTWFPSHHPMLIAASVMMATFMEVLDTSVANVSLPHIAGNLSASTDESTWVLTSYLVANAIILPATNYLSGLFGRKRFFIACITLFTIASALCGAAQSLGFLVLARVLQGAGGGALQPISQAVMLESFPPHKRGQAMAIFAMGVIVAPIIGPTLGGWITDNFSWRWVFYINLPVGILAVFMAQTVLEDPPYLRRVSLANIDIPGFSYLSIWLATLQYVLDRGQEDDWFESTNITVLAIICVLSFLAFVWRELTTDHPLVDLRVLANRNFCGGVILICVLGAILYGTTATLPLFLQNLLGYSSLNAGLALSPRGVAAFTATIIVGRLLGKVNGRNIIAFGFVLLASSSFVLSRLNLDINYANVLWPTIINGFSISCIFVPLTTLTMGTLKQEQMGNAAGIYNLMRNLGGSIGIAGLTTLLARRAQTNQAMMVDRFSELNPHLSADLRHHQGPVRQPWRFRSRRPASPRHHL
ncbi:MAG: DHA2 family efflux MFS transporter permease subunit [Chthoniobacteraceae bacterium]